MIWAVAVVVALAGGERAALEARWIEALGLAQKGSWKPAAALFERLLEDDELLAAHAAYHAARARLRGGEAAAALTLTEGIPGDAIPAAEAELVAIDALVALQRWAALAARAEKFLADFPAGPRRHEAVFASALANERMHRLTDAAVLYRRVWAAAPAESWSTRAAKSLTGLQARLDAGQVDPAARSALAAALTRSGEDWLARGMVLFERNQNAEAEAAFKSALAAPGLSPAGTCQAKFHLAQSVMKARERGRAEPLFAEAEASCRAAGDDDMLVRASYQRGRCLINVGDHAGARAAFLALEAAFPDHRLADDARLRAAEAAVEAGDLADAEALLGELPQRHPTGDMLGEALFRRAFRAHREGRFAAARSLFEDNVRRVPRATVWYAEGRPEYWLGRGHEAERRPDAAVAEYERAIRRYPLSYHAWLAFQRLAALAPRTHDRLLRELRPRAPSAPPTAASAAKELSEAPAFQRAVALARVGLFNDAHRELARLGRDGGGAAGAAAARERLGWQTAALLHEGRLWSLAHGVLKERGGDFRAQHPSGELAARWLLAYPRAFADLVEPASRENRVPAALQYALMREESAFDPRAVSTANCLGLTMLKPETAKELLGRAVERERLFDPALNVPTGSRQLARVLRQYGGALHYAIPAYNAGPGAVARWRAERGHLPADEFVETIPYDETRRYTQRVLASYFAYTWLYASDAPVPPATCTPPGR